MMTNPKGHCPKCSGPMHLVRTKTGVYWRHNPGHAGQCPFLCHEEVLP